MSLSLSNLVLPAVLALSALLASPVQAASPTGPVAGVDYVEIAGGEPFVTSPGKIEVVEVFGYTCIHCAHFEPLVDAWQAKLPADVVFRPVPAPFGGYWIPYARAFHAAQEQDLVGRTHAQVFRALHEDHSLPIANATTAEITAFYAAHGADPKRFAADMDSPTTDAKLQRARDFMRSSGVEGTPTLIVNGRYRVLGKSFQQSLEIADALVARERARLRRTPGD